MEQVAPILENFIQLFKDDIFNFYNRSYGYIKDILVERDINLRKKTSLDDDKTRRKTIETMLNAIKLAFITIGVPKNKLLEDLKQFNKLMEKKGDDYLDYNSYIKRDLKDYIDQVLLNILIEYLIDLDTIKISNLDLFDLLPRGFINRLKQFKKDKITSSEIKDSIKGLILEIKDAVIPADFLIKKEEIAAREEMVVKIGTPEVLKRFIKKKKLPKKKVTPREVVAPKATPSEIKKPPSKKKVLVQELTPQKLRFSVPEKPKLFLDYIGRSSPINYDIINEFNVDKDNLINSKDANSKFLNLENLFYYITILRLLNIELPLNSKEIIDIAKNYISGKIFSASKDSTPDPINNFFGLTILSELNLLYNKNIKFIDFIKIQMFLESELKDFIPEKLHLNFFTILCLKILEKGGGIIAAKNHLINPILSLDILSNLENNKGYNPIFDIFEHLACIKLLDRNANLSHFRSLYISEIKKLMSSSGFINDTITDSARALLIMNLLVLKKAEFATCQHLLNYIIKTRYFNSEDLKNKFNWKEDKLAYTIELRMLFWSLLACSQYKLIKV
jgi:hypothetical protein